MERTKHSQSPQVWKSLPLTMTIDPCTPWSRRLTFEQPSYANTIADDNLLVEELNGLSVREREQIYEEVHGVVSVIDETPEFVAEKIEAMQNELSKIPRNKKKALDRAVFLRPSILQDNKLLLLFLRARMFDPVQAAHLMYKYYENKLQLFGENLLVKTITLNDLGDKEIELLRTGAIQILTGREQAGRGILLGTLCLYDVSDWQAFIRYVWYVILSAIENDEELQKRGIVEVISLYGTFRNAPSQLIEAFWRMKDVIHNWPFRVGGFHLCFDNPTFRAFLNGLNAIVVRDRRLRERCHFGSPLETTYALLTFGMSTQDCFTLNEGIMSPQYIEAFLTERQKKEAKIKARELEFEKQKSRFAFYPNPNDVLMGRGKPFREWPGNIRLAKIVALHALRYAEATNERIDKTIIAMQIVHMIENDDAGRFLQRTDDGWEVVEDSVSKEKVSQALRTEARALTTSKPAAALTVNKRWPPKVFGP